MALRRKIKVLVVDDSAYNRKAIAEILEGIPEAVVVGKAADGQEALQIALASIINHAAMGGTDQDARAGQGRKQGAEITHGRAPCGDTKG